MNPTTGEVQQHDLELPTGWARTKFDKLYELAYGKSLTKAARIADGEYPVYGSNGIVGYHDAFLVEGPAIVVGRKGATGSVSFSTRACWPIDTTYYVRANEHIDIKFSFYLLTSLRLDQFDRSTAIPGLNRDDAYDLMVSLPPLPEQRRIVAKIEELFSELDKGIESLKTARRKFEVYRQSILKHAFEGKLTAQWRAENKDKLETPEQLLARIKKERAARYERKLKEWKAAVKTWEEGSKLGKKPSKPRTPASLAQLTSSKLAMLPALPKGQVYTYLVNLGELERGKSKHRPRNAPELFSGPYPFIQTKDVKAANRTIRNYSQTYSDCGLQQSKLWPEGTLCITIAANIAETAFLGFDSCFPDSIVGFTATETLVLPSYVRLFIESFRTRIEAYAPATAQKNINLATLQKIGIPLCSLEEQRVLIDQLEALLSVVEEQKTAINRELVKADVLRQAILKKAFAGQLVAQDPNDEPAAVLLKRIRAEREKAAKNNRARKTKKRKTTA